MKGGQLISVVVAVYDGAQTIKRCLDSVLGQTGVTYELIVIDGGSSDGTVDILGTYEKSAVKWISEPDQGIYNAWNKALKIAAGEWICFIGSDDVWACSNSLSKLEKLAKFPEINLVSGRNRMINSAGQLGRSYGDAWNFREMKTKMTIAHVGTLHHRTLFEKYGLFDESYRIVGDYEFLLRSGPSIRGAYLAEEVILMGSEGISRLRPWLMFTERRRALCESLNAGIIYGWAFYIKAITKRSIRTVLNFFSTSNLKSGQ